jgi:serine/threonine-protein kinase
MEMEMALAMMPKFGGRIGDALVGLGVLRPIDLIRSIQSQLSDRYIQVMQWRSGECGWVRGVRSHEEVFPVGVNPFQLIARGAREGFTGAELEAMLSPLDEELLRIVEHPPVRREAFALSERESSVLSLVDGKKTLKRLVAEASSRSLADPEEVMSAVFVGLSCEMLTSRAWTTLVVE